MPSLRKGIGRALRRRSENGRALRRTASRCSAASRFTAHAELLKGRLRAWCVENAEQGEEFLELVYLGDEAEHWA